jgi:hypothetical protein
MADVMYFVFEESTYSSWCTVLHGNPRYCYCLQGGTVQGVSYTATITDLVRYPIWVLVIPYSLTSAGGNQQTQPEAKQVKLG